jgi:hypothetical protein
MPPPTSRTALRFLHAPAERAMLWGGALQRFTLHVGGTVVAESRGAAPEAECALFDPGDIELEAERPGTIRERGYRTRAAEALERLSAAGITPQLTAEARDAARPALARAYARGGAARSIVHDLEAWELFDAPTYDAPARRYEGQWLDVAALARDLGGGNAGAILQALHLASRLSMEPADGVVWLAAGDATWSPRPGQRSLRRVSLAGARALVDRLKELRPTRARDSADLGPTRAEAVAWLRAHARSAHAARFAAMEAALSAREPPARGPLAETALWNLETKLSQGDTSGVLEQLDALERRRGRAPGTMYLRARLALATQSEEPRGVAERVSALSTSMAGFHELQLLAARAWLAAGDVRRARAFARDLHEDVSADDVLRQQALEVLDESGPASSTANAAVGGAAPEVPHVDPLRALTTSEQGSAPTDLQPPDSGVPLGVAIPRAPRAPTALELEGAPEPVPAPSLLGAAKRSFPPGTSFPPYRLEPQGARAAAVEPSVSEEVQRLETLALPPGLHAEPPPSDDPPRNPAAARLACTYLARELGRELRLRHGVEIQDDVDGLEVAQRYLRETLVDGQVRTAAEEREVMRYGAFLSELVARHLGGRWIEVQSRDAGTWAMLVPSQSPVPAHTQAPRDEVTRIWPFGRVLRFVVMGHRERDLVSYYLELEARCR